MHGLYNADSMYMFNILLGYLHSLRGKNPCLFSRWQLNGSDINLAVESRYELNGGDLVVINPHRDRDSGSYQCFATNLLGTIVSREAKLQFACKFWPAHLQAPTSHST